MCQQYQNEFGMVDLIRKERKENCSKGNHNLAWQMDKIRHANIQLYCGIPYVHFTCEYCYKQVNLMLIPQENTEYKDTYIPNY